MNVGGLSLQLRGKGAKFKETKNNPSLGKVGKCPIILARNLRCIFQLRQSLGRSLCWSVLNEFYGSVMLFLVYKCCYSYCSLQYQNILQSYFAFLAAIAALKVTMSVRNKFMKAIMLLKVYVCCCNQSN